MPRRSTLALQHIALLEGLPVPRLEALAQECTWLNLPAGQTLLARSEKKSDVFFLVSGQLRVTTYAANGRQVTFRDSREGEHFGDLAAIDGQPRSADVLTLAPSIVARLHRDAFLALLREEPLVAERVMRGLTALVRQLSERVIDLSTMHVQQRVHAELLRLSEVAGIADNVARLEPAPTHSEFASRVSTGREQVTREFSALIRAKVLAKDGRALVVRDVARLHELLNAPGRPG